MPKTMECRDCGEDFTPREIKSMVKAIEFNRLTKRLSGSGVTGSLVQSKF